MYPATEIHTHREAIAHYYNIYYSLIDSGQTRPFLYPWGSLGGAIVLLYLMIDHREKPWLRRCRFLVFGLVILFSAYCISNLRARGPASAFGVGLISGFLVLWTGVHIALNDCQSDYRRMEIGPQDLSNPKTNPVPGYASKSLSEDGGLRQRLKEASVFLSKKENLKERSRVVGMYWQPYPWQFGLSRIDWLVDMFINFRGVGWNWQSSTIPPGPSFALQDMGYQQSPSNKIDAEFSVKHGVKRFFSHEALWKVVLFRLLTRYLLLDAVKTLMTHDPYYWLPTSSLVNRHDFPAPGCFPSVLKEYPIMLRAFRLLLSLVGIQAALGSIFNLGPLFFCFVLGPRYIGIRGEAWMNPDMFGSFEAVFDKGLAGWWGAHWHQVFRISFEAPGTWLLALLKIDKKSNFGRSLAVIVAFTLSGCLHACGSYTALFESRPLRGSMSFFLLQICGVLSQCWITQQLMLLGITRNVPRSLRRAANFAYTYIWLYYTAHLLCDDFASAGVWLLEPLPVSILRAFGLGAGGESWWCWCGGIIFWRQGSHLWNTGIAF